MQSDNMDWEWLLKEFFLQICINLFCLLVCVIVLLLYFYKLHPLLQTQPIPATPIPETFEYEEELGQIKVDILAISSALAAAKKLKKNQNKRLLEKEEMEEARMLQIEQNNRVLEDQVEASKDEEEEHGVDPDTTKETDDTVCNVINI